MNYKSVIKSILPQGVWPAIRRKLIVVKHRRVANSLKYLVEDCDKDRLPTPKFKRKANLPTNERIIWQYWAQGYDSETLPELAKICLSSVEKHGGVII